MNEILKNLSLSLDRLESEKKGEKNVLIIINKFGKRRARARKRLALIESADVARCFWM
jgi:hypothetical protein